MQVSIRFFGGGRQVTGRETVALALPPGSTVQDAVDHVTRDFPDLLPFLPSCRWAKNLTFTPLDAPLEDGDELALLPPVAGGAPRATITSAPLDPGAVIDEVAAPAIGGTVSFVGTVRDHAHGKAVARLEYEAYEPMALAELEKIIDAAEARWPEVRLAIHHRTGSLAVGEIAIVIAAASPHRAEAFEACRFAIEAVKRDVPIWKKEIATDGERWVGWGG